MPSITRKAISGAVALLVVAASGIVAISGPAAAAPGSVERISANTRITRTVSDATPSVGDEITISTAFQRTAADIHIFSYVDYTPRCLNYVQGSATWHGAKIANVRVEAGQVTAEAPSKTAWRVPMSPVVSGYGEARVLAMKYKVSDECKPGSEFTNGNMNYDGSLGGSNFTGFAPKITIAGANPPTTTPTTSAPPTTTPSPPQKSCYNPNSQGEKLADIIYIGVRGSGQTSGMGEQAWNYYQTSLQPTAARSGRTVTYKELDYPSAPVSVAVRDFAAYKSSYDSGLRNLKLKVGAVVDALDSATRDGAPCSNAKIVFGGYSQGALVVHRFLQDPTWERRGLPWKMSGEYGGAILFADPDRFPGDGLQHGGFNTSSAGIAQIVPGTGASRKKLTGNVAQKSYSVCMIGDVVCDYTTVQNFILFDQLLERAIKNSPGISTRMIAAGVRTHMSAYKVQSSPFYYGIAATRLSNNVVQDSKPR